MTNPLGPAEQFRHERAERVRGLPQNERLSEASGPWLEAAFAEHYMYNFDWLGRPIIQLPADMVAVQELLWTVKPQLVIETGIAHGGSLILSASVLALLDLCDATEAGQTLDPSRPGRTVLGIDIDIRSHNRDAIESHPLANRIAMIEGPSTSDEVVAQALDACREKQTVVVFLDSNHTHDHVLDELRAYAPMTTPGSYCVVFDTIVEFLPEHTFPDRPWNPGNSPYTAIDTYLHELDDSEHVDAESRQVRMQRDEWFNNKLINSAAPGGFLVRSPQRPG